MADSDPVLIAPSAYNNQNVTLYDRYNTTFTIELDDIDRYVKYGVTSSIIFAAQIGACFAVLVILVMLTKAEKRKSPVFILNSSALFFNIIGALMSCLYFTGPWYSPYVYLSGDYDVVSNSAKAVSVAPGVFACIVTIAIELSLILQLKVVCVTLKPLQRLVVTFASTLVALVAVGFRIAQVTITSICALEAEQCLDSVWLFKAQPITTTISICFFSSCFCAKLGWSLSQRRKMGLTQFGPMQIIFIGGFQTLFVPALFAIIQYTTQINEIKSNILTVTAISLPLSSLWASKSVSSPSAGARGPDAHRKFLVDSSTSSTARNNKSIGGGGGGGAGAAYASSGKRFASGSSKFAAEKDRVGMLSSVGSEGGGTPHSRTSFPTEGLREKDLEMQDLGVKH